MQEIKVEFETITPLWTGDAWGENSELKATSIMGSLKAMFANYCEQEKIKLPQLDKNGVASETLDYNKYKEQIGKRTIKEILKEQKISLESQLFGCTGWRSRIEIKEVNSSKKGDKYTLNYIILKIDKNFFEEFNEFKRWLDNKKIYVGKGQRKKIGGKIVILKGKIENKGNAKENNRPATKDDIYKLKAKWR